MTSIFDQDLTPVGANYAVQSPVDFIERTASVYPDFPSIIHGAIRYNWSQTYDRSRRLASALKGRGIGRGDTVAVMLPNIPAMVECHFGVPMIGAVLNTLNVRLDAEAISFMLEHGEAKIVIADREFGEVVRDAVSRLEDKPLVIDVDDPEYGEGVQVSDLDYEAFLKEGDPQFQWSFPDNEWDAISLNYTSGTTGNPKGVVYHHRGAYINALGNQAVWSMGMHTVYLWTQVIGAVEEMGIKVTHVYGLTEVYGPVTVCAWKSEWDELPLHDRAKIKARQGVRYHTLAGTMVGDIETMEPVPKDGKTIGEIFLRGNTVMKGYLKNPKATAEAFRGGWFHTGDLAVWHEDGYMEIKDRLKDIIISGGENISTIEVEDTLYRHPAVLEAAVVARPDEKWGETPCAFVTLKPEAGDVSEDDIINFCREHLARFKVPKTVVFSELPKTSTGKIQKFVLRDQAKKLD